MPFVTNHIELTLSIFAIILCFLGLLFPNEFQSFGNRIKNCIKSLGLTNCLQLLTLAVLLAVLLASK